MGNILRSPINGNALLLTPRSASHSFALAAMLAWWPDIEMSDDGHPAGYLPPEIFNGQEGLGMVVRNPVERFRSMVAHKPEKTLAEHLENPIYPPLPSIKYGKYFCFETELNACAEWLGLPIPLPHEDASNPALKPNLTLEQENIVRQIYADDFILWESLNNKGG